MEAINPLYFFNILIGIALSASVAFVAFGRDRNLSVWACGFALYPIAFALFGYRDYFPSWVPVIFGNAALMLMFALFSEGLRRLNNLRLSRLWIWGPIPFGLLGIVVLVDDFQNRLYFGAITTVYHSFLMLYMVRMSFKSDYGRGRWLTDGAVVLSSITFLLRALFLFLGFEPIVDFMSPGAPQTVLLSLGAVWLIMFAIGLLVKYMERAESAMMRLALHDPLTQLGNRRVLQDRLTAATKRSAANGQYGAFMVLDLDHFKELNDTYGHSLGDQLLVEVAYRLKDAVNDSDTVVRLGGDEFVLLIEDLDVDRAQALHKAHLVVGRILEKLNQAYRLQSHDPRTGDSGRIIYQLSLSMGVDLFFGETKSSEVLFRNADKAMYLAKESGRNRAIFFEEQAPRLVGVA